VLSVIDNTFASAINQPVLSMGIDISYDIFGATSGIIVLEEMSKRTFMNLHYGAVSVGKSILPAGIDLSTKSDRVGLTFAIENLANTYYREQFQFAPARGRSFTVGFAIGAF